MSQPPLEREMLQRWLCGNEPAIELISNWFAVFHLWDDLKDRDREVSQREIDRSFYSQLVMVPNNPFFQAHQAMLTAQLMTSIMEWHAANELEASGDPHDLEIAYTLRCNVLGIIQLAALLCGGHDHAMAVGPEIRRFGQRETLAEYVGELTCQTSSVA